MQAALRDQQGPQSRGGGAVAAGAEAAAVRRRTARRVMRELTSCTRQVVGGESRDSRRMRNIGTGRTCSNIPHPLTTGRRALSATYIVHGCIVPKEKIYKWLHKHGLKQRHSLTRQMPRQPSTSCAAMVSTSNQSLYCIPMPVIPSKQEQSMALFGVVCWVLSSDSSFRRQDCLSRLDPLWASSPRGRPWRQQVR